MAEKDSNNPSSENLNIEETFPHQINSPSFKESETKMEEPFINKYGVTIGDSHYASDNSPLENWSKETDPAVMAGEEWVHPTNDIGWNLTANRELVEKNKLPQGSPFLHPTKDVSHGKD